MSVFLRKYNLLTVTGTTAIRLPLIKRGVVDYAVGADWTPAAGDVKIAIDGAAPTNVTNLPTAVASGNGAYWEFIPTAAELTCKQAIVTIVDAATKAIEDDCFIIETFGNASAMYQADLSAANLPANVIQWGSGAVPATNVTGVPLVDDKYLLGTVYSTPATAGIQDINVKNINAVSASAVTTVKAVQGLTTADTIATYTGNTPQTGDAYAIVNSGTFGNAAIKGYVDDIGVAGAGLTAIPTVARVTLVDTTTALTTCPDSTGVGTLLARLTALRAGYLDNLSAGAAALEASLQALTTTVGTAGAGLTAAGLTAAGVRSAVGLGSANLDTQLAAIAAYIDTEVAAILAKVNNLPSDPADASDIAASFASLASTLATIASYIDTEVAAIKNKTDNLPASPAATGDIPSAATIAAAVRDVSNGSPAAGSLGEAVRGADAKAADLQITLAATAADVTAIKDTTDDLTFTVPNQLDVNAKSINDAALTGDGDGTPWGPA